MKAIQDMMAVNHCYGCGPANKQGLQLKSYSREEDGELISTYARFTPAHYHNAGPLHFLNGGIQATLLDCHGICTALSDAYYREGRAVGTGEAIWYATGQMDVSYKRPVEIDKEVLLEAQVESYTEKKTVVNCQLLSEGEVCATARVTAVKVPNSWFEERT
ncbi:PaaI family thioesterase [Oceanicoccus sp. KOV_DT_Chl]|uniref:PaaI family thioesterase n=1 Tax=Oceanicoccus sp. KOV_DT_Chl TaxID=1904639 RepID=UPI000C7BF1E8|nr:PaaI family thioesterase [Oceanicoccus sp. KOV_DT_Chl]